MAHFSVQRFIPLVALGFVMGTVYVRSKNLLSSILLHSLWNLYIFYQLAARGVM
jgi:membrane protease YdiL (CAAX protease family)